MLNPPENDKDENPELMKNNRNYFIERLREFEKPSDEYLSNQNNR